MRTLRDWLLVSLCAASLGASPYTGMKVLAQTEAVPEQSQDEALEKATELNSRVVELYQQGRYVEAVPLAQEALMLRETALGRNHTGVATSLSNLAILHEAQGDYTAALPLYERALSILETALGENHPDVAISLNNLALLYRAQGNYTVASPLFERALSIRETALGENHTSVATSLNNLAELYRDQGDYTAALPLYKRALSILETALGENHPDIATSLNNLALLYQAQGNYAAALPLYERSLSVYETALGENHPDVANSLNNLALLYKAQGNYTAALPLYERALSIRKTVLGENHPDVAISLHNLAGLYQAQGNYAVALPLYEQALSVYETTLGKDHPNVAAILNGLAALFYDQGNHVEALPLYERALSIRETALGENHPSIAVSLSNLALLYQAQGNYAVALPFFERALSIFKTALGENHPDVATSSNNLAELYRDQGNYTAALPLYEQALSINETTLGEDHPSVAISLNNLAGLYRDQGNYTAALPLYEQALSINETTLGENHPSVATSLNNLALLYRDQGNYTAALPLYEQALSIREISLGENHPDVATSLNNLAGLYKDQNKYAAALPLYERALSAYETALGENHPSVATSLNNLAGLHRAQGNYTVALPLYERALSIDETVLGENHPDVATSLNNLAELYRAQGNYTVALPLHERALSIRKTALGENHPYLATSLNNLAGLYWAQDDTEKVVKLLEASSVVEENNLSDMLLSSSENRKQLYIKTWKYSADVGISFNIKDAVDDSDSTNLALSTILRRKGRVLDSTANSLQRLRQQLSPAQQSQLDELSATRSALSNLQLSGPGNRTPQQYRAELEQLETKAEAIGEQLARASAEFRTETAPISISTVQSQIHSNAALVEFIRYTAYNPKNASAPWGDDHYAAYVLTSQGEAKAIDLGLAAPIDQLATQFQTALSTRAANATTIARQLNQTLMSPLRPHLSNKTHLLISPDSQLNLIPFDALVDEDNNYLIETYQTSYLSSGRDLLKLQQTASSQQPPVIIANPNYAGGETVAAISDNSKNNRSIDADSFSFAPLPGTAQEAEAIAPLLPNATLFTEDQATESNLKQVNAPSILHIATHGFFLPDVEFIPSADPNSRSAFGASLTLTDTEAPAEITPSNTENPLLRSGLALSGANIRSSGSEDGIFTALEASDLNLSGTQLVVLSACETGVGSISNGEGVYGLRRTFAIAGAQSQLMSLWQVSDTGTSELMQLYYQNLIEKKQGRSEALRNAQLELLNTGTYQHPYYWSSFIFSGNWRPLE